MTRLFLLIALFFCSCACAQVQSSQNNDELSIHNLLEKQAAEWNKGNIDGYMKGYWESDSLVFIGSSGPQYGYRTTLKRYKTKYPTAIEMGHLALNILSINKLSDDYYFVIGKWALVRKIGDVGGAFTLLVRRINGQLLIVVDHSS